MSDCPFDSELCSPHARCLKEVVALDHFLMDRSNHSIPDLMWARFEECTQLLAAEVRDRFEIGEQATPYCVMHFAGE